jgi:hypothetical protein
MAAGRKAKMYFRPVAVADPLEDPLFKDGWWFVPENQDKTIIPLEAKRGVKSLQTAGITVVQTIVGHEAPQLLTAPVEVKPRRDWKVAERSIMAAKIVGTMAVTITVMSMAITGLVGFLLVSALMIDPSYIAVCRDEHGNCFWIEVAAWFD